MPIVFEFFINQSLRPARSGGHKQKPKRYIMANQVNAAAAVAAQTPTAPAILSTWETNFNTHVVEFISDNLYDVQGYFGLKAEESSVWKVLKVAAALIASFALY